MLQDQQASWIQELEAGNKELKLSLEKEKLERENLQEQYKRLQRSIEQEEFNNPEKTVKFQVLLKENVSLKDNIAELNQSI